MFLLKYPRLICSLIHAIFAGLAAAIVCLSIRDTIHISIYVSSAMIAAGFWASIITKRSADREQTCTYMRAAILGFTSALLTVLTVGIPIDTEVRLINMVNGLASLSQTLKYIFIDDMSMNLGCGCFVLLVFGWYLVPMGSIAGIILLELCKVHNQHRPWTD